MTVNVKKIRKITYIAVATALATILSFVQFPYPIAPYMKFDPNDIVILICTVFLGWPSTVFVVLLRSLIRFLIKGGIFGEIAAICSSLIFMSAYTLVRYLLRKSRNHRFGLTSVLVLVLGAAGAYGLMVLPIPLAVRIILAVIVLAGTFYLVSPVYNEGVLQSRLNSLIGKYDATKYAIGCAAGVVCATIGLMTLNYLFITPSNVFQEFTTGYTLMARWGLSKREYFNTYIIPVMSFNLIKWSAISVLTAITQIKLPQKFTSKFDAKEKKTKDTKVEA